MSTAMGGIVFPSEYKLIQQAPNGGELYEIVAEKSTYGVSPFLLSLAGNRSAIGFDAGYLMADAWVANYDSLLGSLLDGVVPSGWEAPVQHALERLLDWQWGYFETPQMYLDEMEALGEGGLASGKIDADRDLAAMTARGVVLANMPGDLDDILYVLLDELVVGAGADEEEEEGTIRQNIERELEEESEGRYSDLRSLIASLNWPETECSMFGAWGSRTVGGHLRSGRNLDWNKDTGINAYKLVTVVRPEGKTAHAFAGFASMFGALTGLSAAGITVHEANLESDRDSFRGFPWVLRLRYVMEEATAGTLEEATNLWAATNNTVGFNHMIGSAADDSAVVMETQAGYTAYFRDQDPREDGQIVNGTQVGFALPEALYRTNHGYDEQTWAHYQWNTTHAYQDSQQRYEMFFKGFSWYESADRLIGDEEAVNMTALLGSKGDDYYKCGATGADGGSNVLSVAFAPTPLSPSSPPSSSMMYVAWEEGTGANWTPAACNSYLALDMQPWFSSGADDG